mmetsp:Transcript_106552/g.267070  ORF Transcript_106552/g.267070 Transcript_106552/m.267070 type:complete len:344 (+) Transcript_106552:1-1032(+)
MPCKNFYNYMDGDMPCANGDRDRWLNAFFSDVGRMQQIKATEDPQNVFQSHLLPRRADPTSQFVPLASSASATTEHVAEASTAARADAAASNNTRVQASSLDLAPTWVWQSSEASAVVVEAASTHVVVEAAASNHTHLRSGLLDPKPALDRHLNSNPNLQNTAVFAEWEGEALSTASRTDEEEGRADSGAMQALAGSLALAAGLLGVLGVLSLARPRVCRAKQSSVDKHDAPVQQVVAEQSAFVGGVSVGSGQRTVADWKLRSSDIANGVLTEDVEGKDWAAHAGRRNSRHSTGMSSRSTVDDAPSAVLAFWSSSSSMSSTCSEPEHAPREQGAGAEAEVPDV